MFHLTVCLITRAPRPTARRGDHSGQEFFCYKFAHNISTGEAPTFADNIPVTKNSGNVSIMSVAFYVTVNYKEEASLNKAVLSNLSPYPHEVDPGSSSNARAISGPRQEEVVCLLPNLDVIE